MKTVLIATNNAHKAEEIASALAFEDWEFRTLRELGIRSDPAEDADSFEGNARIKALAAHEASGGMAALADDSGLQVDALGGAPGVYSARYAGEDATDAQNNAKLLAAPTGFTMEVREVRLAAGAGFVVVICGNIMTMPGLPKKPAAVNIDVDADGKISGLF